MESAVPANAEPTTERTPVRRRSWWLFLWNVLLSSAFHGFIGLSVILLISRWGCGAHPLGGAGNEGENGRGGSGGQTVEISIQGPEVEHPAPIVPGQAAPPAEPTPEAPTPPAPEHTQTHAHTAVARPSPSSEHAQENDHDTVPAEPAEPPSEAHASSTRQATGGGTGAAITSGGQRAGSVGHQRAILPAAQACADPVAGVWRALKYDPLWGDWFHVTMRIHHGADDALTGTIVARMWDGGPNDVRPPACGIDGFDFTVDMPGQGHVHGQNVTFGANTWRLRGYHCNAMMRPVDYRPDHFTGVIDPSLQEFQSVNNDGGRAINDPMVFRRVACLEDDAVDPGAGAGGSAVPSLERGPASPSVEHGSEPASPEVTAPPPSENTAPTDHHGSSAPAPREMLGPMPHFQ